MAPQTHDAPYYDSNLTYGHDYMIPQFHFAPFLDTVAKWGHTPIRGTATAGIVVKLNGTAL